MKIDEIKKENISINSGIYIILNIINGKVYVGSSHNIYSRLKSHKSKLLNNKHENSYLQRSFNKNGKDAFDFQIVKECSIENLHKEEQNIFDTYTDVYNLREIVESNKGYTWKLSPELRKKWSDIKKGKTPVNLKDIQQKRRRKVAYYVDNNIIKIFNSCKDASDYFNMKPNVFNLYIGKKRKMKKESKYFKENERVDYYEN